MSWEDEPLLGTCFDVVGPIACWLSEDRTLAHILLAPDSFTSLLSLGALSGPVSYFHKGSDMTPEVMGEDEKGPAFTGEIVGVSGRLLHVALSPHGVGISTRCP